MTEDVDLSKLQKFLGKSKMVMEATKVNVPGQSNKIQAGGGMPIQQESNYSDGMTEKPLPDMNQMLAERGIKTNVQVPVYDENLLYEDAVANSKLPPHIKKLMAENRIEAPLPQGPKVPQSAIDAMNKQNGMSKRPVNERIQQPQQGSGNINTGFSREEMKAIVKECLSELMMESITESAIKGTLKKLMTEGKLKVKQ